MYSEIWFPFIILIKETVFKIRVNFFIRFRISHFKMTFRLFWRYPTCFRKFLVHTTSYHGQRSFSYLISHLFYPLCFRLFLGNFVHFFKLMIFSILHKHIHSYFHFNLFLFTSFSISFILVSIPFLIHF